MVFPGLGGRVAQVRPVCLSAEEGGVGLMPGGFYAPGSDRGLRGFLFRSNALQAPPVLHCLAHMAHLQLVCASQVGDAAGDFEAAVNAAPGPAQAGGGEV